VKTELKILVTWIISLVGLRVLLLFPHQEIEWISLTNTAVQLLLFIISVWIIRNSHGSNKFVYFNFALLFLFVLLNLSSIFINKAIFTGYNHSAVYYYAYVNKFGWSFVLCNTILFAIIDDVKSSWPIWKKYFLTLAIVGGILTPSFYSYLENPVRLSSNPDYILLYIMKQSHDQFTHDQHREPSDEELLAVVNSSKTIQGVSSNNASNLPSISLASVLELKPFMSTSGLTVIYWKPLNVWSLYVKIFALVCIIIFLFSMYRSNKPHAAYLDKLMMLFTIFCLLEIFHTYGSITNFSQEGPQTVFIIGQYFTVMCLLLMVYAFSLRLRFVLSTAGKYYETVLIQSPERITRWRDEIDTISLKLFFHNNKFTHRIGQFANASPYNNETKKGTETP
jgi:hypothetical protein